MVWLSVQWNGIRYECLPRSATHIIEIRSNDDKDAPIEIIYVDKESLGRIKKETKEQLSHNTMMRVFKLTHIKKFATDDGH